MWPFTRSTLTADDSRDLGRFFDPKARPSVVDAVSASLAHRPGEWAVAPDYHLSATYVVHRPTQLAVGMPDAYRPAELLVDHSYFDLSTRDRRRLTAALSVWLGWHLLHRNTTDDQPT